MSGILLISNCPLFSWKSFSSLAQRRISSSQDSPLYSLRSVTWSRDQTFMERLSLAALLWAGVCECKHACVHVCANMRVHVWKHVYFMSPKIMPIWPPTSCFELCLEGTYLGGDFSDHLVDAFTHVLWILDKVHGIGQGHSVGGVQLCGQKGKCHTAMQWQNRIRNTAMRWQRTKSTWAMQ